MATKPLTSEAIALTEKKMDMTLDEIIKMSKTKPGNGKYKNQKVSGLQNKSLNVNQDRSFKVQRYMDSRSTLRQGFLAQRRSNFRGNQLPVLAEAGRNAVVASFHSQPLNRNKAVNWNKPRSGGPLRRQGNEFIAGNSLKQQQQQPRQLQKNPLPRFEMVHNQKPKTLDSLFANMKEQRMRASNHMNKGVAARGGGGGVPRQPWLRLRFGKYRV